ncbi:hypothetical protein AV530_004977 [Patagioenas fasciata monilis]|uniref:Uncharacterized protein n=1 Tax=Patagioenas fasciata monilis TaxID=372326 RepID=A0A1V4K585_PATFA|nr:hypothetical protein AV530_004977 [Patagioenas fasciata monilis]
MSVASESCVNLGLIAALFGVRLDPKSTFNIKVQSLVWTLEITLDGSGLLSVGPGEKKKCALHCSKVLRSRMVTSCVMGTNHFALPVTEN